MKQITLSTWRHVSGVVLGLGVGLPLGAVLLAQAGPQTTKAPEVLRAQRFELIGKDGKVEAELSFSASGRARLLMRGNGSRSTDSPGIELEDNEGRKIFVGGGGNNWLQVIDREGLTLFAVGENSWGNGKPELLLRDRERNAIILKASVPEVLSLHNPQQKQ